MSTTWQEKELFFETTRRIQPTPVRPDGHPLFGVVYKPLKHEWFSDGSNVGVRWHVQTNCAVLSAADLHMLRGDAYAPTEEAAIELAKAYVEDALDAMTFFLGRVIVRHQRASKEGA